MHLSCPISRCASHSSVHVWERRSLMFSDMQLGLGHPMVFKPLRVHPRSHQASPLPAVHSFNRACLYVQRPPTVAAAMRFTIAAFVSVLSALTITFLIPTANGQPSPSATCYECPDQDTAFMFLISATAPDPITGLFDCFYFGGGDCTYNGVSLPLTFV